MEPTEIKLNVYENALGILLIIIMFVFGCLLIWYGFGIVGDIANAPMPDWANITSLEG